MTNKHIARTFKLTSDLIELTGGNAFRARAFSSAARSVDSLEESVAQLVREGRLTAMPGIGSGLASDIETLLATGSFDTLDQLLAAVPPGLLDVLRLKGFGPKKVRVLWQQLGATSLDDLEEMALAGRVANLEGFGKKTEEKLLAEIHRLRSFMSQRHYFAGIDAVGPVLQALQEARGIFRAEPAGALRRRVEVLSEIEIVVAGEEAAVRGVLGEVTEPADEAMVESVGRVDPNTVLRALPNGLPLLVHLTTEADFARFWWLHTGSSAHVEEFESRFGKPEPVATESAVYERAGLAFVPPELREGRGELDAAAADAVPKLIETGDLRGTIHNHTTASDGTYSLREMASAARAMGYEYFGVSDHSRSLVIANGLSVDRLLQQAEEVRALNNEFVHGEGTPFRVFHGNEVDILPDGSLDYPDDILEQLDFVVASVHSRFGMSEAEATERIVRAVLHPLVDILGHPTGRLLLRRDGYPVDFDAVIDACAATGTAIELNANPYRLDIDWRLVKRATDRGVLIAINPDAHSIDELRHVQWGVSAARKGWLTAEQCLNSMTSSEFAAWLTQRRVASGVGAGA